MYFNQEFPLKDVGKYLTKSEMLDLFHILDSSRNCCNESEIKNCISELEKIVPFDCFTFCLKSTNREIDYITDINLPAEYFNRYCEKQYSRIDPILTELLRTKYKTINWYEVERIYHSQPENIVVHELMEFDQLSDGFTCGVQDKNKLATFWWGGKYIERNNRSKLIFELVMRYFTMPFLGLYKQSHKPLRNTLTPREIEVLCWIKEGKSSWDISKILKVSVRTVNFHVNNILTKLEAVNRVHAVAIAIEEKLIPCFSD